MMTTSGLVEMACSMASSPRRAVTTSCSIGQQVLQDLEEIGIVLYDQDLSHALAAVDLKKADAPDPFR
jgi:ribosomal protein S19E (S16A)